MKPKKNNTVSLKSLIASKKKVEKNKYISREFQDYGYQLAERLGDLKYKSLYIKLAKDYPREVLERVYSFVADYPDAKNKGKLFMWKMKEIAKDNRGV
jgi:hypothetical protein